MAAGSDEIFFFNTSDNEGIPMWSYDLGNPIKLSISANGKYIVASNGGEAYLFNSTVPNPGEQKEPIWFVDHDNTITSVDISADGKYIVTAHNEGSIFLYNNSYASTGYNKTDEYLYVGFTGMAISVAISADGRYVAAGSDDTIFLFNTTDYTLGASQMPMWSFSAGFQMYPIAISADGSYIVAGSYVRYIAYLFNSTVPEPGEDKSPIWFVDFQAIDGGLGVLNSVDISADEKYVVMGGYIQAMCGLVRLYDNSYASSGFDKSNEYLWYCDTINDVYSVVISADGEYIAARTIDFSIFLFNNKDYEVGDDHEPTWSFKTTNKINSVSMSAWGNYIAAGGDYGSEGITFLFYHARPLPIISGGGGDDDDDDKEDAIPFGNYYLLLTIIALISLIIVKRKKIIFHYK